MYHEYRYFKTGVVRALCTFIKGHGIQIFYTIITIIIIIIRNILYL